MTRNPRIIGVMIILVRLIVIVNFVWFYCRRYRCNYFEFTFRTHSRKKPQTKQKTFTFAAAVCFKRHAKRRSTFKRKNTLQAFTQ